MKKLLTTLMTLAVGLGILTACSSKAAAPTDLDLEAVYQAITDTQAQADMAKLVMFPETDSEVMESFYPGLGDADAYLEKAQALEAENGDLRFALADLDSDNTPELIADHPGFSLSVYTWADGQLITLIDSWPYGAMGNPGYDYVPGGNIIRSITTEQAGAVEYAAYYMVDENHQIVSLYEKDLTAWHFADNNRNGILDNDETYTATPVAYYYGDTEITAEEYAAYQIPGEYQPLMGRLTTDALSVQLAKTK